MPYQIIWQSKLLLFDIQWVAHWFAHWDLLPQTHGKDHFSFLQNADPPTNHHMQPQLLRSAIHHHTQPSPAPSHPTQPVKPTANQQRSSSSFFTVVQFIGFILNFCSSIHFYLDLIFLKVVWVCSLLNTQQIYGCYFKSIFC